MGLEIPVIEIVSLFFILKLLRNRRRQLYHSSKLRQSESIAGRIFGDLSGIDTVCRIIQYTLIFIGGLYYKNSRFKTTHTRLIMVSSARKLDNMSNFFGIVRKITRYPRTFGLMKDLKDQIERYPRGSRNKIVRVDALLGILGNATNIMFFFGDHYMGLFIAGIFTNKSHLATADFWATFAWFLSSIFLLIKDFTMYYIYTRNEHHQVSQKNKFVAYLLIDAICNIFDTISNIAFFYDGYFSKQFVGFLGVASGLLWLSDFLRY